MMLHKFHLSLTQSCHLFRVDLSNFHRLRFCTPSSGGNVLIGNIINGSNLVLGHVGSNAQSRMFHDNVVISRTSVRDGIVPYSMDKIIRAKELSLEAHRILNEPNAGGKSVRSEAYAMDILSKLYGAKDVLTEMEITYYYHNWKKCDFITTINDENIGVSVTRVLPYKNKRVDDINQYVAKLLHKKLYGLVVSRAGALDKCAFSRSILFAWSPDRVVTRLLQATFKYNVSDELKDDVDLFIVESDEITLLDDFDSTGRYKYTIPPPISF